KLRVHRKLRPDRELGLQLRIGIGRRRPGRGRGSDLVALTAGPRLAAPRQRAPRPRGVGWRRPGRERRGAAWIARELRRAELPRGLALLTPAHPDARAIRRSSPERVWLLAAWISTSASSPGRESPMKFTTLL